MTCSQEDGILRQVIWLVFSDLNTSSMILNYNTSKVYNGLKIVFLAEILWALRYLILTDTIRSFARCGFYCKYHSYTTGSQCIFRKPCESA